MGLSMGLSIGTLHLDLELNLHGLEWSENELNVLELNFLELN